MVIEISKSKDNWKKWQIKMTSKYNYGFQFMKINVELISECHVFQFNSIVHFL